MTKKSDDTEKPDDAKTTRPAPAPPRRKDVSPQGHSQMRALQAKFKAAREAVSEREDTSLPSGKPRRSRS
jgi:hypothetical protein